MTSNLIHSPSKHQLSVKCTIKTALWSDVCQKPAFLSPLPHLKTGPVPGIHCTVEPWYPQGTDSRTPFCPGTKIHRCSSLLYKMAFNCTFFISFKSFQIACTAQHNVSTMQITVTLYWLAGDDQRRRLYTFSTHKGFPSPSIFHLWLVESTDVGDADTECWLWCCQSLAEMGHQEQSGQSYLFHAQKR